LVAVTAEVTGAPVDGEALWRFSVAFYARPGISEVLIALQDRAGCDVNLMLFALWLGITGRGRLTNEDIVIADRHIRPLRTGIVEPLRELRRKLRSDPDADVRRLREGVKELELGAERIIQTRLARLAGLPAGDTRPTDRAAVASANLALYLGPEIARSAEVGRIREALEAHLAESTDLSL
jgi:uncharacterized protein (TIGR02444 family)